MTYACEPIALNTCIKIMYMKFNYSCNVVGSAPGGGCDDGGAAIEMEREIVESFLAIEACSANSGASANPLNSPMPTFGRLLLFSSKEVKSSGFQTMLELLGCLGISWN